LAQLLEDEAPMTCETIKTNLPFEIRFQHSIVSGQAIVGYPSELTVAPENQRVLGIPPGTLSFLVRDETRRVPDEVYISYGVFVSRSLKLDMNQPVNVFAQIEQDIDQLQGVCKRILIEGAELVRFSLEG